MEISRTATTQAAAPLASMRALLEELDDAPGEVTLIYRASTQQELVFREELDEIASRTGASVHYVLGPRLRRRTSWLPESAANLSDSQALLGFAPHLSDSDVYICGALGWMTAVRDAAYDAGVSPEQVHLERFSW